jgi:hypothetical protein
MHAHTPPFTLPDDAAGRKAIPLASGLLDYFPDALVAVASLSFIANEQHNPGEPLHWDRNKSTDHDDCLLRHFLARGTVDTDQVRHRTKVAWRALAALQEELETVQGEASLLKLMRRKALWESATPSLDGSRIATPTEIDAMREVLTAEELKGFGIGDVEPRHPLHAEVLRDEYEKGDGETGV